jgi:tryptophan-rich sensory protein
MPRDSPLQQNGHRHASRSRERRGRQSGSLGPEKIRQAGDLRACEARYGNMTRPGWKTLTFFVGGVTLVGLMLGYANTPGVWYGALNKPAFNPPNYLFAPVWLALYVCIGIAGARTWSREPRSSAMAVWLGQMALNFLWSPVFFGMHRIGVALIVIIAMLAGIVAFIALQWRADRVAALLFIPYAAWVAFAATLNWTIYRLN